MVLHVKDHLLFGDRECVGELDILHRSPDRDGIRAAVKDPCAVSLVVGLQRVLGDRDFDGFGLSGSQKSRLGKAAKLQLGLLQRGLGLGDIALHDLTACCVSRIGDGHRDRDVPVFLLGEDGIGVGKGGIGQAKAEGEGHVHTEGLVVAVAHVDILVVGHVMETAGEIIVGGGGLKGHRPRSGELARRVGLARQHVGHGVPRLLTGVADVQDGIHAVPPGGGLNGVSRIDENRDLLARGMEGLADTVDHVPLGLIQAEVTEAVTAVHALDGLAGQDDHSRVRFFGAPLGIRDRHLYVLGGIVHVVGLTAAEGRAALVVESQGAACLDAVKDADIGLGMDDTRAAAAINGSKGTVSEEGYGRSLVQRQSGIILEQHEGLLGCLSCQLGVSFIVDALFLLPLGGAGLGDHREDVAATGVQRLHGNGTAVDRGHQNRGIVGVARHIEVVHGLDLAVNAPRYAAPIAGDHTHKAELIPQDVHQKLPLGGVVVAVDAVVGGHDHPRRAVTDGDAEALEVDLAEGALGDVGRVDDAGGLLIVDGEMLDLGTDARGLHAVYVGGHEVSRQKRILGAILEIAPAECILLNVHTGSQKDIRTEGTAVQTDGLAHTVDQVLIPGV